MLKDKPEEPSPEEVEKVQLEQERNRQREVWLRAPFSISLIDFLVMRERQTLELARGKRGISMEISRDLLAKSEAFNEVLTYARSGKSINSIV